MKLLFLHHQQRRHFKDEPGYNELFRPFIKAKQVTGWSEFVYQTLLRQFLVYELAVRGKRANGDVTEFILRNVTTDVYEAASLAFQPILMQAIEISAPDLIVYPLTWTTETIHPAVFRSIKTAFPKTKLFTLLFDNVEDDPFFRSVERETIAVSDFYAVADNHARVRRMLARQPPYEDYVNLDVVHWFPTVHDPDLFRPLDLPKTLDVAVFGSSEGSRRDIAAALQLRYGSRFRRLGGNYAQDAFLSLEDYVRAINQTKVVVNTQTFRQRVQLKGRVREVLSCGAFLLEEENSESRDFLEGSGVVLFSGYQDLFAKIDYFLRNEDERERIARATHDWYRARYTPDLVVQRVIDAVFGGRIHSESANNGDMSIT